MPSTLARPAPAPAEPAVTALQAAAARSLPQQATEGPPVFAGLPTSSFDRHVVPSKAPDPKVTIVTEGTAIYCHKGTKHVGRWEVAGLSLKMTCTFGSFKISAGQGNPQKTARNLLKSICRRAAVNSQPLETELAGGF